MGRNRYGKPDPLELARGGAEDALEQVLGGVVAPVFDRALHRYRQPVRAELATVEGLRRLAESLRGGGPSSSPVAEAARGVFESGPEVLPASVSTPLEVALSRLSSHQRATILGATACDLDAEELAYALQRDLQTTVEIHAAAMDILAMDADELRDTLDEEAGRTPLPPGLTDRALA